jgi:hypothetical protein
LRVASGQDGGGVVVDEDIRVGAVVFDPPRALAAVKRIIRLLDRAVVNRRLAVQDADQAAPRRDADDRPQLPGLEMLDKRFAVRTVVLVGNDDVIAVPRRPG